MFDTCLNWLTEMFENVICKLQGRLINMLKHERLNRILQMVNDQGIVTAQNIMSELNVSDMTVRRDLDELEKNGKLIRIRGGAQSLNYSIDTELSHLEKSEVHPDEKLEIARRAAQLVHENDTIFLGPGTTIELMASQIQTKPARVITNSLPVFEIYRQKDPECVLLTGGSYRPNTGCFVGPLTDSLLEKLNVSAAFISCNGIAEDKITTSSMEEGQAQAIALNNAHYRYLLADESKFNREDFYTYYRLYHIDGLITDSSTSSDKIEHYSRYTKIIQCGKEKE